jgi:hypothetical protein
MEDALLGPSGEDDSIFWVDEDPDGLLKKMYAPVCREQKLAPHVVGPIIYGIRLKVQEWSNVQRNAQELLEKGEIPF